VSTDDPIRERDERDTTGGETDNPLPSVTVATRDPTPLETAQMAQIESALIDLFSNPGALSKYAYSRESFNVATNMVIEFNDNVVTLVLARA
jgi:hypothetical protein